MFHRPTPLYAKKKPYTPVPKKRWRVLRWIGRTLKAICLLIGATILVSILLGFFASGWLMGRADPKLPEKFILLQVINTPYAEKSEAGFGNPFEVEPTLYEVVSTIDSAALDPRVTGLAVAIHTGLPTAQVQELREVVKRFRATGKQAWVFANSYSDSGTSGYYLATAFDQVWMQPLGTLSIPGVTAEIPYARDLLDRMGIYPEFHQRKEYKNAYEPLERSAPTEASREATISMVRDIHRQVYNDIASDRGISNTSIRPLIDKGLLLDYEASQAGLIDEIGYGDTFLEQLRGVVGNTDTALVDVEEYNGFLNIERTKAARDAKSGGYKSEQVALIYLNGPIMTASGEEDVPEALEDRVGASSEVAAAISNAGRDPSIKAVVLRVNSPGGSPTASESIRRAIVRVQKESGKPVIISMGDAAASGGYWVSAAADYIFANPSTLTGSIGVLGGKFSIAGLWDKLDVNWVRYKFGKNAGIWSMNTPFKPTEAERLDAMVDQIYAAFLQVVAEGRGMDESAVEQVAKGHVWTGAQAVENGLVDELGGLNVALAYAAQAAEIEEFTPHNVVILPRPKNPFERLMEMLGMAGPGVTALSKVGTFFQKPAVQSAVDEAALFTSGGGAYLYAPVR